MLKTREVFKVKSPGREREVDEFQDCIGEWCAWWDEDDDCCCVKSFADWVKVIGRSKR